MLFTGFRKIKSIPAHPIILKMLLLKFKFRAWSSIIHAYFGTLICDMKTGNGTSIGLTVRLNGSSKRETRRVNKS